MSAETNPSTFDAVWLEVQRWPAADRLSLASQILESVTAERAASELRARPAELIGAWSTAGPVSDSAIRDLLDEELLRKHG
jgi:hypothetical protein